MMEKGDNQMINGRYPLTKDAVDPVAEVLPRPVNLGILGYNLSHTISPLIHRAGAGGSETQVNYLVFDVKPDLLDQAVRGMAALGFRGCNVTIPYKEDVGGAGQY